MAHFLLLVEILIKAMPFSLYFDSLFANQYARVLLNWRVKNGNARIYLVLTIQFYYIKRKCWVDYSNQ